VGIPQQTHRVRIGRSGIATTTGVGGVGGGAELEGGEETDGS